MNNKTPGGAGRFRFSVALTKRRRVPAQNLVADAALERDRVPVLALATAAEITGIFRRAVAVGRAPDVKAGNERVPDPRFRAGLAGIRRAIHLLAFHLERVVQATETLAENFAERFLVLGIEDQDRPALAVGRDPLGFSGGGKIVHAGPRLREIRRTHNGVLLRVGLRLRRERKARKSERNNDLPEIHRSPRN